MLNATVLVIIVTWNKKDYVIQLLQSLATISYPKQLVDIVVVDNASEDGTVEALAQYFPTITVLRNAENLGGTGGFNTGLAWAFAQPEGRYDYLWLLDNDVLVHQQALQVLVSTLEQTPDAAVAGSTMLQLDYHWQINEMGAFVDRQYGTLILNRHFETVPGWREKTLTELLTTNVDLTTRLLYCSATLDVDYVAAASLLIRAPIAKQVGLWEDFFIHFDDVEWCLRIGQLGQRVLVCANSLIWHLSAAAKVPSWVLYYDNRNVLYLLAKHGTPRAVKQTIRKIAQKTVYYALLGKTDLAQLHLNALDDFQQQRKGKKAIQLTGSTQALTAFEQVFSEPALKTILVSCILRTTVGNVQTQLVNALRRRPELKVFYLHLPSLYGEYYAPVQIPGAITLSVSKWRLIRYWQYFKLRNRFDAVLQSDYQAILPLSWLGGELIFVNHETFCRRPSVTFNTLKHLTIQALRSWFQTLST